jgi:protein-tyrosine phosphatase
MEPKRWPMARTAVGNGIDYAVMTPHLHPGCYENVRTTIEPALLGFRYALRRQEIPLECDMAAEVPGFHPRSCR